MVIWLVPGKPVVALGTLILSLLITASPAFAQEATAAAGVTPDSLLYGIDVALDNINLALTFDRTEKARKGLEVARERLMEVREMIDAEKLEAAQTAQQEHANALGVVQDSIKEIELTNSTEEIEKEIEIEKELEEHKTKIEEVRGELKIKIEVEGVITPEQQALIDSVLASLEGKAGEVEIEIENEKGETKIKIEQETGKSEEEVENEVEDLEEAEGLTDIRKEKARDKIKDAEEEINETIEELSGLNITDGNIASALDVLAQAKEAFSTKDYKDAIKLAEQAEDQIKDYGKQFEELEEKRGIEVEIKGNWSKVKVEIAGIEAEFVLETTDRNEIISGIASRTGLSVPEIESIMKIEVEGPKEEVEIEEIEKEESAEEETEAGETEGESEE